MASEVTNHYVADGPYPGAFVSEIIEATVDTDANGDGTLADVALQGDYSNEPIALVGEGSDVTATIVNKTATDLDIQVTGSGTTSGTVDVFVAVHGPRGDSI